MTSEDGDIYEQTFPLDELGIEPGVKTLFNTQVWDNDGSLTEGFIGISAEMGENDVAEWANIVLDNFGGEATHANGQDN